ncbi:phage antirepressor KilAC domain-containing protein, partial [Arthrospira platensis SPKY1]|nr:phage antirepressor KilAC domain-containing protein [Arthrospira platensis SPKY1]
GSLCVTNAAKDLQIRPKDLFNFLSSNKWIYKRAGSSTWVAYQEKLQQGLLEHKTTEVTRSDGSSKISEQVRITAKGLTKIARILADCDVA